MISHYLELFWYYRRLVIIGTIVAGCSVLLLSMFLLIASPFYKAVATVTMQPTEAELAFTQGWLGVSQFNPAAILTQTHIEHLLSRPVAEKALQLLLAGEVNSGAAETGLNGFVKKLGRSVKRLFWKTWNTLNYGKHIPLNESAELLITLMEAIDVEVVEGSYIINIEVLYDDPIIAAKIANVIATAYVHQSRIDYSKQSDVLRDSLISQLEKKEQALSQAVKSDVMIRHKIGITDIVFERELLLASRDREIEKRSDDAIKLSALKRQVKSLQSNKNTLTRRDIIDKVESDLIFSESQQASISSRISDRGQVIELLGERLLELQEHESKFHSSQQKQSELKADIEDLRRRLITVSLAESSGLSQVRMINPPIAPLYPWFPKVLLLTIAAVIVGFVLMFLIIVILDTTGRLIITSETLRSMSGIRSLGVLSKSLREKILSKKPSHETFSFQSRLKQRISIIGGWQSGIIGVTAVGDYQLINEAATCIEVLLNDGNNQEMSDITCLPPVNGFFDYENSGIGCNPIICVLRPGEVEEDEVKQFIAFAQQTSEKDQLLFIIWHE